MKVVGQKPKKFLYNKSREKMIQNKPILKLHKLTGALSRSFCRFLVQTVLKLVVAYATLNI